MVRKGEERRYTDNGTNSDACTCVQAGNGGGGHLEASLGHAAHACSAVVSAIVSAAVSAEVSVTSAEWVSSQYKAGKYKVSGQKTSKQVKWSSKEIK